MGRLTWVLLAVLIGLATHIGYVLFQPARAFARELTSVLKDAQPNSIRILSPSAQARLFPSYRGPGVLALCLVDLRDGPVRISASMPSSYWTVVVNSMSGAEVYSINDAEAASGSIDVRILKSESIVKQVLEGPDTDDGLKVANAGWTVELPEQRGIASLWAPLANPYARPEIEALMARSTCGTDKR
jgi:uncharacterized membrane protein